MDRKMDLGGVCLGFFQTGCFENWLFQSQSSQQAKIWKHLLRCFLWLTLASPLTAEPLFAIAYFIHSTSKSARATQVSIYIY
jgi:hypothetical protein